MKFNKNQDLTILVYLELANHLNKFLIKKTVILIIN